MFEEIHWHAILVHFPIALLISACMIEIFGLTARRDQYHQTAGHIYALGCVFALLAVISGWFEAKELHLQHPLLTLHRTSAFVTLAVATAGFLFYKAKCSSAQNLRKIFLAAVICAALAVSITGYFGGKMVYEYGVGVKE